MKKFTSGFIALISVIIISAILLLVATNLSFTGFYGRYNILDSEYKERSSALAEACVDQGLLMIANDSDQIATTTIVVGTHQCYLGKIDTGVNPIIFMTQAIFQNSYTNLSITFNTDTYKVTKWEEVP